MDYEKKYKEIVGQIKKAYLYAQTDSTKAVLENIFPELKESEDERIRQEILDFCKNKAEKYPNDPKYKNISAWIAWLEKQEGCEYIKKDWLEHIKQSWYKEGFIDGKYSGEKQGEKKHTDNDMVEALRTEYEKGRADAIAEMENEWKGEDDDLLVSIEDSLSDYLDYTIKDNKLTKHSQDIAELRVLGYIDWLKSLNKE